MEHVQKLSSKEVIRNIHVLNQLAHIFNALEGFCEKWFGEKNAAKDSKGGPSLQLCKFVDKLQEEEHIFPWVFDVSRDDLKLKISTLMCELASEVEEQTHNSIYGSFDVIASDLQEVLWMRNTRQVDNGETMKHF